MELQGVGHDLVTEQQSALVDLLLISLFPQMVRLFKPIHHFSYIHFIFFCPVHLPALCFLPGKPIPSLLYFLIQPILSL